MVFVLHLGPSPDHTQPGPKPVTSQSYHLLCFIWYWICSLQLLFGTDSIVEVVVLHIVEQLTFQLFVLLSSFWSFSPITFWFEFWKSEILLWATWERPSLFCLHSGHCDVSLSERLVVAWKHTLAKVLNCSPPGAKALLTGWLSGMDYVVLSTLSLALRSSSNLWRSTPTPEWDGHHPVCKQAQMKLCVCAESVSLTQKFPCDTRSKFCNYVSSYDITKSSCKYLEFIAVLSLSCTPFHRMLFWYPVAKRLWLVLCLLFSFLLVVLICFSLLCEV